MDEYGRIQYRQIDREPAEGKLEANVVEEGAYSGINAQPSVQHAADNSLGESDFDDFLGEFDFDFGKTVREILEEDDSLGESDFDDFLGEFDFDFGDLDGEFGEPRKPKRPMTYEPILHSDSWNSVVEKFKFGPLPDNEWPADVLIMAMVVKLKNITRLNAWIACINLRSERDAIALFRSEYARHHNLVNDSMTPNGSS